MSLANAIASGVAAIKQTLSSGGLLVTVTREPYLGPDLNGRDAWGAAVAIDVLFEDSDVVLKEYRGSEVTVTARITVLDGTVIHERDRWILADGRKKQAKRVAPGVLKSGGGPMVTEVWLG